MSIKFSVIIPTYNRAYYIADAVKSVLEQSYAAAEIIVIDDGSTDNTQNVLQQFGDKITYIYQENQGVSAARNKGIFLAKEEYTAFLDSDDIWLPRNLEFHRENLEKFPFANVSIVNMKLERGGGIIDDFFKFRNLYTEFGGKEYKFVNRPLIEIVKYQHAWVQNTIVKSELIKAVNIFNYKLNLHEDLDFFARLSLSGNWVISRKIGVQLRRFEGVENLSAQKIRNPEKSIRVMINIFEKLLVDSKTLPNEKRFLEKALNSTYRELINFFIVRKEFGKSFKFLLRRKTVAKDFKTWLMIMLTLLKTTLVKFNKRGD